MEITPTEVIHIQPILRVDQLAKCHPAPTAERPYLFTGIQASINPQDSIALVGASGQGKSTLLRVLARLEQTDGGVMALHEVPSAGWAPTEWRKKVCYVPQAPAMLPTTVEDNLAVVCKLHAGPFDRELARRCMEEVRLGYLDWGKKATELSGGERQRLQLVRSLMLRSDVYLLDEVTSSLDAESKAAVERMLLEWSEREGTALVWITHDAQQADTVGKRTWRLENGTLQEELRSWGEA